MNWKGISVSLIPVFSILALCGALYVVVCTDSGNPSDNQTGEITNFNACVAAGHAIESRVNDGRTRICRTPEGRIFPEEMSGELCSAAGGHWNECSNRCRLEHQGEADAVCPAVCETLCECGGIAGFSCSAGYECILPAGIADALGYCVPSAAGSLTADGAYRIAIASECAGVGNLSGAPHYNANSRTWWIDLEPREANPLCHPACVVHEDTNEVEINWRCTGLIPPE